MDERIPSGIYGLDELIGGGFRKNTVIIIHGGIGVGKTTFCLQYALYGLNRGEKAIFVSFEMTEKQIIRDCKQLGFEEIENHIQNKNLKVIHIYGEDLAFPSLSIMDLINENISGGENLRIIIDPLTHYSMFLDNEKRKTLSSIFQNIREIGTSIITLEDFNAGNDVTHGSSMPMYLADTVIHLDHLNFGEFFDRTLRIVKHRGSKHGKGLFPYDIETGLGIIIEASESDIENITPTNKFDAQFKEAIGKAKKIDQIGDIIARRIELLRQNWTHKESPEYILDLIINEEKK